ncbi:hypothetical protein AK88_03882 [Plasmodium fragile]|uniref:Schizont egress antigen-1 n=1 Tax=Plasmodium fragile TaxID=5857 RepID=A0A0D9QL92_PLAFR|nr:uncharacterized protein AK88_03882 [Plasmodium fragile]KJP86506.1 hypothetical protein AK88_03882 [Plasmodium fragile]
MGDHENVLTLEEQEEQLCYLDRYDVNELIGGIDHNDADAQCNESNSVCEYEVPFLLCKGDSNMESNREESERNSIVSYLDDGASTIISKQDEDNATEEDSVGKTKTKKKQINQVRGKGNGKNEQTAKEKINIIFIPSDGSGLENFEEILSMKNMNSEHVEKKLNEKFYQICCKSVADINTYNLSKVRKASERQRRGTLHVEHIDYGDIFLSIRDSVTRRERRNNRNLLLRDDSRRQLGGRKEHQQALLGKRQVKNAYNYRFNGGNFFKSYRKKDTVYCHPIGDRVIEKGASYSRRRRRIAAPYIHHHLAGNKRRNYVPPADDRHIVPYDEVTLEDRKFVSNLHINGSGKKQNVMYAAGEYEEKKGSPFSGDKIAPNNVLTLSGRSPRGADERLQEGKISRSLLPPVQEEIHFCEEHVGGEEQYYLSRGNNDEVAHREVTPREVTPREVAQREGNATTIVEISQRDKQPQEQAVTNNALELNLVFDSGGVPPPEETCSQDAGAEEKNDGYACWADTQPGEETAEGNGAAGDDAAGDDADVGKGEESTSPPIHAHQTEAKENTTPNEENDSEVCHWREVEGACDESVVSLRSLKKPGGDEGNPFLSSREEKEYFDLLVRRYEKTKLSLDGSEVLSVSVSDAPGGAASVASVASLAMVQDVEVEVAEKVEKVNENFVEEPKTEDRASQKGGEEEPTGQLSMDGAPDDEPDEDTPQIGRYEELLENDMCDLYNLKMHDLKTLKECDFGSSKNLLIKDIFMCHGTMLKEDEGPLDAVDMEDAAEGRNDESIDEDDGEIKSFLAKLKADVSSQINLNNEDNEQAFYLLDSMHANDYNNYCDGGHDLFQDDLNEGENFPVGSKLNLSDLDDDVGGGTGGAGMDAAVQARTPGRTGGGYLCETPRKMEEEKKDTECQTEFPLDFSRNTNRTPRKKSVEVILVKKRLKRMKEEKDDEEVQEGQNELGVSHTDPKARCRRYPKRNRIKTLRYWIGERELTKRNPYTGEIDVVGFSECTNLGDLSPHIIGPIKYKTLNLRDMYPLSADEEEGARHRDGGDSVNGDSGDELAGFHTDGHADVRVKTHGSDHLGVGESRKRRRSEQKGALKGDDNGEKEEQHNFDRVATRLSSRSDNASKKRRKRKFINIVNYIKKRRKKKLVKSVDKGEGEEQAALLTKGDEKQVGSDLEQGDAAGNADDPAGCDNLFHDAGSWHFDEDASPSEALPGKEASSEELPKGESSYELPPVEGADQLVAIEGGLEEVAKESKMEREDEEVKGANSDGSNETTKDSVKNFSEKREKMQNKKKDGKDEKDEKERRDKKKKKDEKKKIKEKKIDQMYKELLLFNLDFLPPGGKMKVSRGAKKDITKRRKDKKEHKQEQKQKKEEGQISGQQQDEAREGQDKEDAQVNENTALDSELNEQKVVTILRTDEVGSTSGEEAGSSKVESKEEINNGTADNVEKDLPPSDDLLMEASLVESEGEPLLGEQHEYRQQSKDNTDDVKTDTVISANVDEVDECMERLVQSITNETKGGPTTGEDEEEEGHTSLWEDNLGALTQGSITQDESDVPVTNAQNDGAKLNHTKEETNDEESKFERNKKTTKIVPMQGETEMAHVQKDSLNEVPCSNNTDGHVDGEEKNEAALCTKSSRNYKTVLKKGMSVIKVVHFNVDRRKHRRSKTGGVQNFMSMRRRGVQAENGANGMGEVVDGLYEATNTFHRVNIPQLLRLKSSIITESCICRKFTLATGNLFSDVKVNLSLYSVRMIPGETYSSNSLHHNLVGYVDAGEKIKIVLGSQERCVERGDFFFIPRFHNFVVDNCSR